MLRFVASTIAVVLLTSTSGALAAPPQQKASTKILLDGLRAIAASAVSQSQGPQEQTMAQSQQASPQVQPGSEDHDQGDDHASDVAIMKVCNHNNPSAQRSAICPQPNSPP